MRNSNTLNPSASDNIFGFGGNSYQNGSNSDDSKDNQIFAKPRGPDAVLTSSEHYEQDEVLKIRSAVSIFLEFLKFSSDF